MYFWISKEIKVDCNSQDAIFFLNHSDKFGAFQQFFKYEVSFYGTRMMCHEPEELKTISSKKIFVPMIADEKPGSRDYEKVNLSVIVPEGWMVNVEEVFEETEISPIEKEEVIDLGGGVRPY